MDITSTSDFDGVAVSFQYTTFPIFKNKIFKTLRDLIEFLESIKLYLFQLEYVYLNEGLDEDLALFLSGYIALHFPTASLNEKPNQGSMIWINPL